jgi:hypothetical protein
MQRPERACGVHARVHTRLVARTTCWGHRRAACLRASPPHPHQPQSHPTPPLRRWNNAYVHHTHPNADVDWGGCKARSLRCIGAYLLFPSRRDGVTSIEPGHPIESHRAGSISTVARGSSRQAVREPHPVGICPPPWLNPHNTEQPSQDIHHTPDPHSLLGCIG